jgi:hypothetical protein
MGEGDYEAWKGRGIRRGGGGWVSRGELCAVNASE